MFLAILSFLTGFANPVRDIVNSYTNLKIQQEKTKSDTERNRINQQIEEAHDRKAVIISQMGNRITSVIFGTIGALLAIPAVVVLWKMGIWDKVVGSFYGCAGIGGSHLSCLTFRTDPLGYELTALIAASIAYFLFYKGK